MKKEAKWAWGTTKQKSFEGLKQCFALTPILWFVDDDLPYQVKADSSDIATGAVLLQQSPEDEKWHPITFYSKSLSVVEQNYKIHDQEMLAIIYALEEW